jgi:hypothetical protein
MKEVLDALKGIHEGGAKEEDEDRKKKDGAVIMPHSPNTVHAPWDSLSTTLSISQ